MNSVSDMGLDAILDSGDLVTPVYMADGSTALVWVGRADSVELATWMPSFPMVPPFERLGRDLWALRLELPETAMIEYRLAVRRGHDISVVLDPLNPHQTTNPFGTNSVAMGSARQRPSWTFPDPDVPAGTITEMRVTSGVWQERRHHHVYTPASNGARPLPLIVVHDGNDFLHHAALQTALDNLIHQGAMPPAVVLLHQPRHRLSEYADDERHVRHVFDEIVPRLSTRHELDHRCVLLGSSLGAVAALSAAWHRPDSVTGLALLSGSFAESVSPDRPAEIFDPIVDLVRRVDDDKRLASTRCYVACGRYEGLIDLNRSLVPRLRSAGVDVVYDETWDGHQWSSWRDRLRRAFEVTLT